MLCGLKGTSIKHTSTIQRMRLEVKAEIQFNKCLSKQKVMTEVGFRISNVRRLLAMAIGS
jgi:hypothetical protein